MRTASIASSHSRSSAAAVSAAEVFPELGEAPPAVAHLSHPAALAPYW